MMKHVIGIGAAGLLLVAALHHPGVAAAHGAMSGEDDPCLRRLGNNGPFSAYHRNTRKNHNCTTSQEGDPVSVSIACRYCQTSGWIGSEGNGA